MQLARRLVRSSQCSTFAVRIALVTSALLIAASGPAIAQTTGSISGTVVDSGTGVPLGNIRVDVYRASGQGIGAVFTAASGAYTAGSLAPGDYFVRTNVAYLGGLSAGYLDEVYNGPLPTPGLPCTASCVVTSGAIVTVAAGVTTPNINFALEPGGRISGTISPGLFPSGCGLGCGYGVSVYNTSGVLVGTTGEYGSPVYTTAPLAAGSYYVRSANNTGYINELYNGAADGLVCQPSCTVTAGTLVQVTVPVTTPSINFALAVGGRISGTVTDTVSGLALAGVAVSVYNSSGTSVASALPTSSTGAYATSLSSALPDGNYFVKTSNSLGYGDELYNDLPCSPSCTVTTGTPVSIAGSVASPATVNFALAQGARFTGTVTSTTGTLLGGVIVQVFSSTGAPLTSATSNAATGVYTTSTLAPGVYYLRTSNSQGFIDQLYQNISCVGCTVTTGTLATLAAPTTTINFALAQGARFTGTVTSTTGTLLGGVTVQVFSSTGTPLTGTTSNATTGVYSTSGLAPGSYYLRTSNSQGFIDQLYQNISCVGCTVTTGTLATLAAPTTTIDFSLAQGSRVSGIVRGVGDAPLGGVSVQVYSSAGVFVTSGTSVSSTGIYTTPSLAPGTYYVRTSSSLGYLNQLYSGMTCEPSCTVTAGTPLTLGAGTTTLDFSLMIGAKVTGFVTGGGLPIANAVVEAVSATGSTTRSLPTNALGAYSVRGLPTGNYFVRTGNSQGYLDEVHDNVPCLGCSPAAMGATPIAVTAGGSGNAVVSFDLAKGGQITGRVSDAGTGLGVGSVSVSIIDASGRFLNGVASTSTDLSGNYATTGLPAGRYFVRTFSTSYVTQVYDSLTCAPCSVTDGMPVDVTAGAVTSGVDFVLQTGGRISGTVTGGSPPSPLDLQVDFINANGATVSSSAASATNGVYTSGALPAGTYFAKTRAFASAPATSQGFVNEVYDDLTCSGCNPLTGNPITVNAGATTPNVNFVLTQGGRVSGRVTDAGTQPLSGATVQLFSQAGLYVAGVATNAAGEYSTPDGLAAGDYYARTVNSLGYIDKLYDVIPPCFPTCTPTSGTAIHVPASGMVANIDFALQPGGRISGRISDASTGVPLAGVSARVYDSAGVQLMTSSSTAAGTYITGAGLPAGEYHVGTVNVFGYINEVHPNVPCLGCSPATAGSAVLVAEGTTSSGIDFALDRGGRIAGAVVASAVPAAVEIPLKGVVVEVFASPYMLPAVTGTTDRLGHYLTGGGLPDGTAYTVRTMNSLGLINERYDDISCIDNCSPELGATVAVSAPVTTASINFALDVDGDQDGDGIIGSIDTDKVMASNGFSDVPQGGTTAGIVVVRNGWSVNLGDLSAGGVVAEMTGSGEGPVTLQTCAGGGAEEVGLDRVGAKANISCAPDTGSTTVRAVAAFPYVELRKTVSDLTTILELAPGQAATLGSPAVADPANTEPVRIRLEDAQGSPVGSFDLDPGESAEATESASGLLSVTVFSGSVAVTVGEEVVTVGIGQSHGFVLCSPLGIESLIASPQALWPPNHKMVAVTLSPTLSGTCGTATCHVVSVISNEPADGLGDGDTSPDLETGEGLTLRLRAERAAGGSGRTYTIVIACTDEAGNTVTKTATVSVPHQR